MSIYKNGIWENENMQEFKTAEGSNFNIKNNTSENPSLIELKGKCEQQQYTGKNLYYNTKDSYTFTSNATTWYFINGNSGAYGSNIGDKTLYKAAIQNGKTYTLSGNITGTAQSGTLTYENESVIGSILLSPGNSYTFTANRDGYLIYRLKVNSGDSVTVSNIQLEEESFATDYEPYVGGIASPNPDYPQDIKVVTGEQNINICGKNYFDKSIVRKTQGQYSVITDTTLDTGKRLTYTSSTASATTQFLIYAIMDLSNYVGKTIRFKADFIASSSNRGRYIIGLCNADGSNRTSKSTQSTSGGIVSFIVPELSGNQTYLYLNLYVNTEAGTINQNDYIDFTDMVLTIDDEDMTYEAYKGQNFKVNLGKNLINNLTAVSSYSTQYTVVGSENKVVATSNTANENSFPITWDFIPEPNTNYTFSMGDYKIKDVTKNNLTIYVGTMWSSYIAQGTINSNGSYTFNSGNTNSKIRIGIYVGSSEAVGIGDTCEVNNPMLEKGSTATDYVPYKTSIKLYGIGNYQDELISNNGKNLFDKDNQTIKNDYAKDGSGNEIVNIGGNYTTSYTLVEPNTTYTISSALTSTVSRIYYYTKEKVWISRSDNIVNSSNKYTFTTPNNCYYLQFQNVINFSTHIQIEKGSIVTSYEPYKKDLFIKRNIGKVVLDGNENYTQRNTGDGSTTISFNLSNFVMPYGNNKYCNYFSYSQNSQDGNEGYGTASDVIYFEIKRNRLSSIDTIGFKDWLSTHNTIIYYVLENPIYETITDKELINQLNSIKLYLDENNINVTSNDIETQLKIGYSIPNAQIYEGNKIVSDNFIEI